jgi:hypothetical protein
MGHADPGFTLRTYTHVMEGSSESTKRAIDAAFLGKPTPEENPVDDGEELE